jgi:glycosyltransferase involved in cell wall biosynthesis
MDKRTKIGANATEERKKVLMFHPALAPYRIDQFNLLSQSVNLELVFIYENVQDQNFDQSKLQAQLSFKYSFLLVGPSYNGRVFRYGMLSKIKKSNAEIVFGYEYSLTTQYLILLKRTGLIKQKIGSTVDDSVSICYQVQSKIREFAREKAIKKLDFLMVLSETVADFYKKRFDLNDNKIIVAPILQKPERLRNNKKELELLANNYLKKYNLEDKKVLLYVGRLVLVKGLTLFINNIYELLKKNEDLRIVIVGEGDERNAIEQQIKKYNLEKSILMPGRFEGVDLYSWYLTASGFILPSIFEPFGAVVNEALIFGLPVLCSKYAGATSIMDYNCGQIFDPLDSEDTKKKLKIFIDEINKTSKINLESKKPLINYKETELIEQFVKLNM